MLRLPILLEFPEFIQVPGVEHKYLVGTLDSAKNKTMLQLLKPSSADVAKVSLTLSETILIAIAGIMRQVQNLKDSRQDYYGAENSDGFGLHITGCLGEAVVAKHLNLYWMGTGTFRGKDVGEKFEVRTSSLKKASLILHPNDADESKFILVVGGGIRYQIKGWIYGKEGKDQQWWRDIDRPAFFVPQSALHPINTLEENA